MRAPRSEECDRMCLGRWSAASTVFGLMLVLQGCPQEPPSTVSPGDDEDVQEGGDVGTDTGDQSDAGTTDAGDRDAGDDAGSERPPVEASHFCAASGVSEGGGYRLIQCTSPVEVSGEEMSGSGYRLQPGTFRVVSP